MTMANCFDLAPEWKPSQQDSVGRHLADIGATGDLIGGPCFEDQHQGQIHMGVSSHLLQDEDARGAAVVLETDSLQMHHKETDWQHHHIKQLA